jgi:hypothetical protein
MREKKGTHVDAKDACDMVGISSNHIFNSPWLETVKIDFIGLLLLLCWLDLEVIEVLVHVLI